MNQENQEILKLAKIQKLLKLGSWAYILLLIFEGALRKWFLPFLATPLLIVRDPIALYLIYISWKHNLLPSNIYIIGMTFIGFFGIITALVFGHGSFAVAVFGGRILFIHFPIMFIMGAIFNRDDVLQVGKILLWISIPMVILIGLQFYSSQSAWVNRGIGGDMEGGGFSGSMGYFRPSGTFSFTSGNVMFFSLIACFVFYFWTSKEKINRFLLIAATVALLASISLSISRTLFFSIGVTLIFTLMAVSRKPEHLPKILGAIVIVGLLFTVLSQTAFIQTSTEAFTARFESASEIEGGVSTSLLDRFFGGMIYAMLESNDLPFFGHGIGMGTNVGAKILTGKVTFLISEGEWGRLVGELGFVIGLLTIVLRTGFCATITFKSYGQLKHGNFLPWLLLSFGLLIILQGQWAQPTALGFSTVVGGLILACFSKENSNVSQNPF